MWRALVVWGVLGCGGTSGGPMDAPAGDGDGAPPPDVAVSGPTSRADLIRACVLLDACGAAGDGINDCFTDVARLLPGQYLRCVVAAGSDCVAVRACLGFAIDRDPTCTDGRSCQGANAIQCSSGIKVTQTCGGPLTTGAMCIGGGSCGSRTCTGDTQVCNGTVAESCDNDILETVDCANSGMQCAGGVCTDPGGGAVCATTVQPRCDGAASVRCQSGIETRFDCATRYAGASCYLTTGAFAETYCGYGATCSPEKGTETCVGNSVSFCAAGEPATLDCTSIGFARCIGGSCAP